MLVAESAPVARFLNHLPWYERLRCKTHLVETRSRPRFSDYMRYISSKLLGETVVLTNQDVFLADTPAWAAVPRALGPKSAFFLSRYHRRESYDVRHSLAASAAEGIFNASTSLQRGTKQHKRQSIYPLAGKQREWHVCDMTERRFSLWRRSLCTPINFGSFDAYVLRFDRSLSSAELNLFDYPQNAWGGENLFLYLVQEALGMAASNPCVDVQAVHMHCELATTFGTPKVGERRLGKREIIEKARAKLAALGNKAATMSYQEIGKLSLNVTGMAYGWRSSSPPQSRWSRAAGTRRDHFG